jgi:putative ABC transport system permease protein
MSEAALPRPAVALPRSGGGWFRGVRVLLENVGFAIRALRANRLRSLLTVLGIVLGVGTVIVMVGIVEGFKAAIVSDMTSFGATLVQFQKYEPRGGGGPGHRRNEKERERRDLTLEDALAIKRLCPSIAAVSPERYLFPFPQPTPVKSEGREANSPVIAGVYPDYMVCNNHFVADGRFITDADIRRSTDVAVIGSDVANALFPRRDAIGRRIDVGNRRYTVIGLFEKKGSAFGDTNDNWVMIPFSTFDRQFPWVSKGGDTIHIATIPRSPDLVQAAIEEGTNVLRTRRGLRPDQPNDFALYTPDKILNQMKGILDGISAVMIFIAAVSLLVGGVGVMNIMLVAVTERTREIGVRKALGARRKDIVVQFLTEAATLTGIGGIVGVLGGLAIVGAVRMAHLLPARAELWSIGLGLAVSISIGLFFGLYPALKAARLDPIEALRYE